MQTTLRRASSVWLPLLMAALGGCSSLGTHPPRATDLSGDWRLNESLSDDPQALMRAHRQEQGHGRGGGHHHGGMPGMGGMGMPHVGAPGASAPPGGGSYGGGRGGGMGPHRGSNNEFLSRPDSLTIRQDAGELHLVADGVPTDFTYGDKVMASVKDGAAERTAGWKGKDFVVKYDVKDGPKASRSYALSPDGKRLTMTTEVSGARYPDIKFRSVYEHSPATAGAK